MVYPGHNTFFSKVVIFIFKQSLQKTLLPLTFVGVNNAKTEQFDYTPTSDLKESISLKQHTLPRSLTKAATKLFI